jgi:putative protease
LVDRQEYRFPLQLDEHCRMTLYNARELCLIEHLGDIIQDGYGSLRLDLRSCEAKMVREITRVYAQALKAIVAGAWSGNTARQSWERLDQLSAQGLTRGHYLRGVLGIQ